MASFNLNDLLEIETSELEKLWLHSMEEFDDFTINDWRMDVKELHHRTNERVKRHALRLHGYIWKEVQPPPRIETDVEAVAVAIAKDVHILKTPTGWRSLFYLALWMICQRVHKDEPIWTDSGRDRIKKWFRRWDFRLCGLIKWREHKSEEEVRVEERAKGKGFLELSVVYPHLKISCPGEKYVIAVTKGLGGEPSFYRAKGDSDADRLEFKMWKRERDARLAEDRDAWWNQIRRGGGLRVDKPGKLHQDVKDSIMDLVRGMEEEREKKQD